MTQPIRIAMQLFLELFKLMNNKFSLIEWRLFPLLDMHCYQYSEVHSANWIDNNRKNYAVLPTGAAPKASFTSMPARMQE